MSAKLWIIKTMVISFFAGAAYGQDLPADEREFMAEIQTLRCGIKAGGEVWPGYGLGITPIVIYLRKSGLTVLFSDSGPLPGFKPVGVALLRYGCGKHGDAGLYFKTGRFSAMERQFTWEDIGGRQVLIFNFQKNDSSDTSQFRVLAHEYFHVFQQAAFHKNKIIQEPDAASITADSYAWMLIEDLLLAKALMAEGMDIVAAAAEFVKARQYRWANEPAGLVNWEKQQERDEGSAQYLDLKATHITDAAGGSWPLSQRLEIIKGCLAGFKKLDKGIVLSRYYARGAAQGIILDRLGAPWRRRVMAGETPFEILKEYVPVGRRLLPVFLLKRKYEFKRWKAYSAAQLTVGAGRENQAWEQFKRKKGIRLTVKSPRFSRVTVTVNGTKDIKVSGRNALYPDTFYESADIFESRRPGEFEVVIKDMPLLFGYTEKTIKVGRFNTVVMFAEAVLSSEEKLAFKIDGIKTGALQTGEFAFKKLSVESKKILINASSGGRVNFDGVNLIIELTPADN